jgi:hypothetical protein
MIIEKNHSAGSNRNKWAFSGQMGSRCKFATAGGLFDNFLTLIEISTKFNAENKQNILIF